MASERHLIRETRCSFVILVAPTPIFSADLVLCTLQSEPPPSGLHPVSMELCASVLFIKFTHDVSDNRHGCPSTGK